MNLATMRTEARLILGQTDTSNTQISESELDAWANEFYRRCCVALESVPIKERLYDTPAAASPTITANSNTITINRVKINEQTSGQWQELKIIDLDDLYNEDSNWENAAAAVPTHFVRTGTFTYRLHPKPNAANASITNALKTHGLELPTSLSSGTDTPDLPANLHDVFPHYMAYRGFSRLGDMTRATQELTISMASLKDMKNISVNFSKSRGWQWSEQERATPYPGRLW